MKFHCTQHKSHLFDGLTLFLSLALIETLFRLMAFQNVWTLSFARALLLNLGFSLFVSFVCSFLNNRWSRKVVFFLVCFFAVYAFVELEFNNFMGNYMSFNAAGDGATRITDYIIPFLIRAKPQYYSTLLIPVLLKVSQKKLSPKEEDPPYDLRKRIYGICFSACAYLAALTTFVYSPAGMNLFSLYEAPSFLALSIKEFGIVQFMQQDLKLVFIPAPTATAVVIPTPVPTPTTNTSVSSTPQRDDTLWESQRAEETNATMISIDDYLMNRPIPPTNAMTGAWEGKNLIYILVEGFDYLALDETLTPTLWMMQHEGWSFEQYYTPKYSCTTGESEFIALTSLVPQSDVCTPNTYQNNTFSEAIFSLFNSAGYTTQAYHNWEDEFYDRRVYLANMGAEAYYDVHDLDIPLIAGWQSDADLVTQALPTFINEDSFMVFMATSSTHFPYDESSTLGDRYLSEVQAVHPNYPLDLQRYCSKAMELDKAMELLLQGLKDAGKFDDTIICLFADHHPLNMDVSYFATYTTTLDRSIGLNVDRTPCFFYGGDLTPTTLKDVASTFDLLPTLANLYNLDYDPRLYMGTDYFDAGSALVYFATGDWVSDEGTWIANQGLFIPSVDEEPDEQLIEANNIQVSNAFTISKAIYQTDYFAKRDFR